MPWGCCPGGFRGCPTGVPEVPRCHSGAPGSLRGCPRCVPVVSWGAPRVSWRCPRGLPRVPRGGTGGAPGVVLGVSQGCPEDLLGGSPCPGGIQGVRLGAPGVPPWVSRGSPVSVPRVPRGCSAVSQGCSSGARGLLEVSQGVAARVSRRCPGGLSRMSRRFPGGLLEVPHGSPRSSGGLQCPGVSSRCHGVF